MRRIPIAASFILFIALCFGFTSQALASPTVYWDFEEGFNPEQVTISPGGSVTWVNYDPYNFDVRITISSTTGGSLSFTLPPYYSQGVTFPYPGLYSVSSDNDDSGWVLVDNPPSVTITNPLNNASFTGPATIVLKAKASDSDGISSVQFFADSESGTELLGEDFTSPYATTNTLVAGTYTLRAVASDIYGMQSSDSISVTVNAPVSLCLTNARVEANRFVFDLGGLTVGKSSVVEYCTNLSSGSWSPLVTNTASESSLSVSNALTSKPRFYRAFEMP